MYELMNNSDLNMYYGGTYMRHGDSVVHVDNVSGERSSAVANTHNGAIPMAELSVFFPNTQVLQVGGYDPMVITSASGRNYKKSYRGGGNVNRMCAAFTASLTASLPSLQEATEQLKAKNMGYCVFGVSGKFYLRKYPEYSVPLLYHLHDFLGYYNAEEDKVVVGAEVNQFLIERLTKNCGGANVITES
ncbi:conserved hypothetical protein [Vibrio phage 275E43-1]|nr:conserved hypothetical protein [Vibrio phage 275E43-1]